MLGRWGGDDRTFFMRSAAKPFQAVACLEAGGSLADEELAVACSSHSAEPVHLALVRRILLGAGLDDRALRCPPDMPLGVAARDRVVAGGERELRRVYHNCSGKHASMLAACRAAGWPTESYRDPEHPLQQRIATLISDLTRDDHLPVGIDGCGLPTFRTTVAGLASAYAHLSGSRRLAPAYAAMRRFPLLTSGSGRIEAMLAVASGGAAKGGAQGCVGLALDGGLGIAAKAHDGNLSAAVVGMVKALRDLGLVADTAEHGFAATASVPVLGGGSPVGALQARASRRPSDEGMAERRTDAST